MNEDLHETKIQNKIGLSIFFVATYITLFQLTLPSLQGYFTISFLIIYASVVWPAVNFLFYLCLLPLRYISKRPYDPDITIKNIRIRDEEIDKFFDRGARSIARLLPILPTIIAIYSVTQIEFVKNFMDRNQSNILVLIGFFVLLSISMYFVERFLKKFFFGREAVEP